MEYTKNELEKIVKESNTFREVLLYFNRNESGSSYKTLKRKLKEFDIDTTHFLNQSELMKLYYNNGRLNKKNNNEIFVENSSGGRTNLKRRIINDNLIEYKCVKCNQNENWMGLKITLILDHINGISNDNRLENLRFLCPNCNATLETHCMGNKRLMDKEYRKNKKKEKILKRIIGEDRPELRKVIWPTKEELVKMLEEMTYCAIGKKYGVSNVAVHKWAKKYKIK